MFVGCCSQKTKIFRWSHIAIDILSTLLLGVLSVPTREETDTRRARGIWGNVVISSFGTADGSLEEGNAYGYSLVPA